MKKTDVFWRMQQQIEESTSVGEVVCHLQELDNLAQDGELSISDTYDLRVYAFRALREFTNDNPDAGEELIFGQLLPYCTESIASTTTELRTIISHYRECLVEWLNQYSGLKRITLRDKVLDQLYLKLNETQPEGTCFTISAIGFRRQDIINALWEVSERYDNETGDIAIATIAGLGILDQDRSHFLSCLHERIARRCNVRLLGALRHLADLESIKAIYEHCLESNSLDSFTQSLALTALTDIADTRYLNTELQDCIWQKILDLVNTDPDTFMADLILNRSIASRCNSERVVPNILEWLSLENKDPEKAIHHRWLWNQRLEECMRPNQLKGWRDETDVSPLPLLKHDACQNTQHQGRSSTKEMWYKESAWDTLLLLGCFDVLTWFEECVTTEDNPFMRQKICNLLACFKLHPLPKTVLNWVTEPYDEPEGGVSGEWAARIGATQIACSAASEEAFNSLLNFGLTFNGTVLQRSVDALVEVSLALIRKGITSVIEQLVETATSKERKPNRLAAMGALEVIATKDLLPDKHVSRLVCLLTDEEREPYERSIAVAILGYQQMDIPPDILQFLQSWARERNDRLGQRSLETLARCGNLLAQSELVKNRLGLYQTKDDWNFSPEKKLINWGAFIIGVLYMKQPVKFTSAVATLIETQSWHSAVQIIQQLKQIHGKSDHLPLPAEIKHALIERTKRHQKLTSAEIGIFSTLAELAPDAIAMESWENTWEDWLPDAKVALADALGEAVFANPISQEKAISLLLILMKSSIYAVRRSAYRSVAKISPITLQTICMAWAQESPLDLRQRAAEAISWIPVEGSGQDAFKDLYYQLKTDQEKIIRQTSYRAWNERRERIWAQDYLSRVLAVQSDANQEVLSNWRYGKALSQLGDDECIKRLRSNLNTQIHPPHIKHWYRLLIEDLDKRWRKVTQKWPDPWTSWKGAIEEGIGIVITQNGERITVHYSIWQQPASTPLKKHLWGGAVWSEDCLLSADDKFTLKLEDGRRGKAVSTSIAFRSVHFEGVGHYPA